MTMDMDAAKRAKKALTTKPKWSFGTIRYWPSKLKPQKHLKLKRKSIPQLKRNRPRHNSQTDPKITLLLQIICTTVMVCFSAIFCVPVLLYGIFKSIQTNRHPEASYTVTQKEPAKH